MRYEDQLCVSCIFDISLNLNFMMCRNTLRVPQDFDELFDKHFKIEKMHSIQLVLSTFNC